MELLESFAQALSSLALPAPETLAVGAGVSLLLVVAVVVYFRALGTRRLLRQLVEETRKTNELLAQRLPDLRPKPDAAAPKPVPVDTRARPELAAARPATPEARARADSPWPKTVMIDRLGRREPYISDVKELAARGK
jgi:hypothetical protein